MSTGARKKPVLVILVAGLLAVLSFLSLSVFFPGKKPKTVVVVVLDTVGFAGVFSSPEQAPFLSQLAADSAQFTRTFSTAPWTKPSVASILTGSLPASHGVRHPKSRLATESVTMAEYFSQAGFATAGFVSHTFIGPKTDYRRGFGTYKQARFKGHVHDAITSAEITTQGLEWLKKHRLSEEGSKQDAFLFLHYFDPHYNYKHHPAFSQTDWYNGSLSDDMEYRVFKERAEGLSADDLRYIKGLYGEEIRFTDRELRRLYAGLSEAVPESEFVLVVTADHGEAFREHNHMGHGHFLYNELVHVPLLIHAPGRVSPEIVTEPVSSVDIFPTLVDLLRMPPLAARVDGHSLVPLMEGAAADGDSPMPSFEVEYHTRKVGAVRWPWKVIFDRDSGRWEVFNLETDGAEAVDSSSTALEVPAVVEAKERVSRYISQEQQAPPKATLPPIEYSEKEVKKLKTLGYMM